MTLAETRAAAFSNAKRQALEGAMTYVQSKTRVKNFQLDYDVVISLASGSVLLLEQKDYGVEGNNRYHVWIKAEVRYDLKPKRPDPGQTTMLFKTAPLTVKVWTSKKKYKEGEDIEIFVRGNKDFYARIVNISPSGKITQLLPNHYRPSNYFSGRKVYKIPGGEDRFDLEVTSPYGEEIIVVYASEAPLGDVSMEPIGRGLSMYRGHLEDLAFKSRSIKIVETSPGLGTGAEFYEAMWTIATIE
jgi:hypothetical protein